MSKSLYYLSTPFCSRNEVQVYQVNDISLYVIHPDNLFDFICANSDKRIPIDYRNHLVENNLKEEAEKMIEWFQIRFDAQLTLGALPAFPRNKNS